nr:ribonuclease H-like domain, reverse transcriptase, RNA-dependent DNA polymerase [Tanacetum cinerariifolium]
MSDKEMVQGLPNITNQNGLCEGCLEGKQARKSFPTHSNFMSTRRLELVHGDLCGPISPPTHAGNRDVLFDEERPWQWGKSEKFKGTPGATLTLEGFIPQDDREDDDMESQMGLEFPAQGTDEHYETNSEDEPVTPISSVRSAGSTSSSTGVGAPKRYRTLTDLYDETNEVLLLNVCEEPTSYSMACKQEEWKEAMKTELDSIERNNTWTLVELPPGWKAIGLKWVYKVKKDPTGAVIKYKARLVAKGYVQKAGIDFDEVYAPVARIEMVRILLALSSKNGWFIHHLDVKSAFLNEELEDEVYFKEQMNKEFEMSDMGLLSYYLGIEVSQYADRITLKQATYVKTILKKTGMEDCNVCKYPMEPKLELTKDKAGDPVDPTEFKSIVRALRYLTHTRPDISYAVGLVSRFMEKPTA